MRRALGIVALICLYTWLCLLSLGIGVWNLSLVAVGLFSGRWFWTVNLISTVLQAWVFAFNLGRLRGYLTHVGAGKRADR